MCKNKYNFLNFVHFKQKAIRTCRIFVFSFTCFNLSENKKQNQNEHSHSYTHTHIQREKHDKILPKINNKYIYKYICICKTQIQEDSIILWYRLSSFTTHYINIDEINIKIMNTNGNMK